MQLDQPQVTSQGPCQERQACVRPCLVLSWIALAVCYSCYLASLDGKQASKPASVLRLACRVQPSAHSADDWACPICLDLLYKPVVNGPCGHIYCFWCVLLAHTLWMHRG